MPGGQTDSLPRVETETDEKQVRSLLPPASLRHTPAQAPAGGTRICGVRDTSRRSMASFAGLLFLGWFANGLGRRGAPLAAGSGPWSSSKLPGGPSPAAPSQGLQQRPPAAPRSLDTGLVPNDASPVVSVSGAARCLVALSLGRRRGWEERRHASLCRQREGGRGASLDRTGSFRPVLRPVWERRPRRLDVGAL